MLTKRKKQVLNYVEKYITKHDYAPSLEEIKKHLHLSSVSTAHYHIQALQDKGYLRKECNQPRALSTIKSEHTTEIPLVGTISAGKPIEAIEIPNETIVLPRSEIGTSGKYYALRVAGNSMINEGIFDGDIVVIKKQETADNGQSVVAIIDENEATLKKIYREHGRIRLQPANPDLFPIYRKEVEIRGVVVKIIRNFDGSRHDNRENVCLKRNADTLNKFFTKKSFELNKIYNMECLEFMKDIENETIDLIFADPPYNLSKSNFKMKFVKSGGSDLNTDKGAWDKFAQEDYEIFTKKWLAESFRILKKTGSIWVAGTYHNIYLTGYLMKKLGFEILNEVLWHKTDATPNLSCTRFVADHENFIWARKDKGNTFNYKQMKSINNDRQMRSIWSKGKTTGGKRIHPTQKPEWLLERILLATSKPEDIVFDPFMGSGTTAVIAKKLRRSFLGTELDPNYYKASLERLDKIKNATPLFNIG
ncbi:MAG: transcriptional repressor LexA [Candidatus Omnitrophica bacterium]|nr:transcriptional repressor LexA [Candidatus Omnitrophota bacterium]